MKIPITCKGSTCLPLEKLKNFQGNLKTLPESELEKLKNSIVKHGFSFPVFVWQDAILDGHQRVYALKKLLDEGYTIDDIPIVEIHAQNKAQAAEKLLILNSHYAKITEDGLYEFLSANELDINDIVSELNLPDFDMENFLSEYIEDQEETEGLTDEDEIPEVPEEPITKPGDLWILGQHRLLCGDSTNINDVEKLMAIEKTDMVLTDPPYNVNYEGKTKDRLKIENDKQEDKAFREFLSAAFYAANTILKPGGVFYIWHADSEGYNFRGACKDAGWTIRQCLIWNKNSMVLGRQDYHWKHEPCLYGWKEGAGHLWATDRKQTTVLNFDRPNQNDLHPTMKPVKLFMYLVQNNTKGEDIVFDPFLGSGTSIIACEKTNRKCYGLELDPHYCDVIIRRWEDFTGNKATLA